MGLWNQFWHGFEISAQRLRLLRFVFFGVLGVDLWVMMLEHAPRYGAGTLTLPQFSILSALPAPSAAVVSALWLLGGFTALRAAFGIAVTQSARITALCYISVYLWSQADSYQHHYLLCLLLATLCVVPWGAEGSRLRHWSLRMIYVQIALLYFWGGFAKADSTWLSGATLEHFTRGGDARAPVQWAAGVLGVPLSEVYPLASWAVMLGEVAAAVIFLVRPLWIIGLFLVPMFHVGVEVMHFEIEWFSYYMIAIDVILLMPEKWLAGLGTLVEPLLAAAKGRAEALEARLEAWSPVGLGLAAAAVAAGIAMTLPLHGEALLALGVGFAVALAAKQTTRLQAFVQVGLAVALVSAVKVSDVDYDYYRLWGGDLLRRGQQVEAIDRYQRANAATEGPARHFKLGKIHRRRGEATEAILAFEEGLRRQRAALQEELSEHRRKPAEWAPKLALAERYVRIAERCDALAGTQGSVAKVGAEYEACRRAAVQDASDMIAAMGADAGRARRLERSLRKLRR